MSKVDITWKVLLKLLAFQLLLFETFTDNKKRSRFSFKTHLTINFLQPYNGGKKCLKKSLDEYKRQFLFFLIARAVWSKFRYDRFHEWIQSFLQLAVPMYFMKLILVYKRSKF